MYGGKSMPTACSPATAFTTTTAKARVARKQSIFLKKYLDIQKRNPLILPAQLNGVYCYDDACGATTGHSSWFLTYIPRRLLFSILPSDFVLMRNPTEMRDI